MNATTATQELPMTDTRIAVKMTFDSETCSRCGGSGTMPFSAYNGVCLKCNRAGVVLTRNGKTARGKVEAWAEANLTVPASTVEPGQRVKSGSLSGTVVERTTTLGQGNGRSMRGVEGTDTYVETWTYGQTVIRTKSTSLSMAAHAPIRLGWTRETLTQAAALFGHLKGVTFTYADEA